MIPKVDNTNVDRSVATIHATVLACLRHTSQVINYLSESYVGVGVRVGAGVRVGVGCKGRGRYNTMYDYHLCHCASCVIHEIWGGGGLQVMVSRGWNI